MKKLIEIIMALAVMSSGAFALEVVSIEDNATMAQAVVVFKNKRGVDSVFLKCIDYSTSSLRHAKKEWKRAEASLRAVDIKDIGFSLVEIDQECQTHIGRVAYAGYHMAVKNRKMCVSGQCGKEVVEVKTKTTTKKRTSVRKNHSGSTTTRKKTPLVKREVCKKGETYHPNNRKGNRCISTLGILGQGVYTGDGDGGSHGHGRGEGHGQSQGHGRGEGHGQGPA